MLHDGVLLGTYILNGEPSSWFSRLQKLVALSTAESEIYAATDTAKVVAHLKVYIVTWVVDLVHPLLRIKTTQPVSSWAHN